MKLSNLEWVASTVWSVFFLDVFPDNSKYSERCSKTMWSFGVMGTANFSWSFIIDISNLFIISLWLGLTSFWWEISYTDFKSLKASTKGTQDGFCSTMSVSKSCTCTCWTAARHKPHKEQDLLHGLAFHELSVYSYHWKLWMGNFLADYLAWLKLGFT